MNKIALRCDSCNFKRNEFTVETDDEATEHEQANADHWVQLVVGHDE